MIHLAINQFPTGENLGMNTPTREDSEPRPLENKVATKCQETREGEKHFATRPEILERLAIDGELLTRARRKFPVQWPKHYLNLVGPSPQRDPIAKMGRPEEAEFLQNPGDLADAIGDKMMRPMPFIVRKHRNRLIVLVTKRCHFYCRFCFRREDPPTKETELNEADWDQIEQYLKKEPELEEVILSGGDPLTLSDGQLFAIKQRLLQVPHLKRWRIHTRAPVHFPQRITAALVEGLALGLPLRWVTHFNHVRELSSHSRRQAHLLSRFGIPFLNQAVLLRGVNSQLSDQVKLWRGLHQMGICSYYLHHPDRVAGNAHFRISLREGLALYGRLRAVLGENAPKYVIDLPDGTGKIPVEKLQYMGGNRYGYRHPNGIESFYTDIPESL